MTGPTTAEAVTAVGHPMLCSRPSRHVLHYPRTEALVVVDIVTAADEEGPQLADVRGPGKARWWRTSCVPGLGGLELIGALNSWQRSGQMAYIDRDRVASVFNPDEVLL